MPGPFVRPGFVKKAGIVDPDLLIRDSFIALPLNQSLDGRTPDQKDNGNTWLNARPSKLVGAGNDDVYANTDGSSAAAFVESNNLDARVVTIIDVSKRSDDFENNALNTGSGCAVNHIDEDNYAYARLTADTPQEPNQMKLTLGRRRNGNFETIYDKWSGNLTISHTPNKFSIDLTIVNGIMSCTCTDIEGGYGGLIIEANGYATGLSSRASAHGLYTYRKNTAYPDPKAFDCAIYRIP